MTRLSAREVRAIDDCCSGLWRPSATNANANVAGLLHVDTMHTIVIAITTWCMMKQNDGNWGRMLRPTPRTTPFLDLIIIMPPSLHCHRRYAHETGTTEDERVALPQSQVATEETKNGKIKWYSVGTHIYWSASWKTSLPISSPLVSPVISLGIVDEISLKK